MDDQLLANLQQTLDREIPLSTAMGLNVVAWQNEILSMRMPLEPNKNHQYSAFAGSLNALCTVVGWGTIFLLLAREGLQGNIVIRRGQIRFLRPVWTSEIVARGQAIDPAELDFFFELMRSKGNSKLVTFHGSYVVRDW
jgi:thioesterase domain-containing protein